MITTDNSGKPIGLLANLTSDKEVVSVNATDYATVITTRDRRTGEVNTETLVWRLFGAAALGRVVLVSTMPNFIGIPGENWNASRNQNGCIRRKRSGVMRSG